MLEINMINIRIMTVEDYDGIYELWINTKGMGLNTLDDSKDGIARFLKRNPTTNFVACDNGKIVGTILSGHDGRRGYIYHTAVLSDYRNRGIARKLVDSAIDALDKESINKAALVVFERNKLGNEFWEKMGFTVRTDIIYRNKNIHELKRIDT